MTYRVRYRISGWIEVEAQDADEAIDAASDYTPGTCITETVGEPVFEIDEAEEN